MNFVGLAYKEAKKEFVIPGLGKIHVASRKRRKGRNPATGEEIVIPAKKVVKFRVSKTLSDAVYPPAVKKKATKRKAAAKKKAAPKAKKRR